MKKIVFTLVVCLALASWLVAGIYVGMNILILTMIIVASLASYVLLGMFISETFDKNTHYKFEDLEEGVIYETKSWSSTQNLDGYPVYLAILTSNSFNGPRYFELPIEPRRRFQYVRFNECYQMMEVKDKVTSID